MLRITLHLFQCGCLTCLVVVATVVAVRVNGTISMLSILCLCVTCSTRLQQCVIRRGAFWKLLSVLGFCTVTRAVAVWVPRIPLVTEITSVCRLLAAVTWLRHVRPCL